MLNEEAEISCRNFYTQKRINQHLVSPFPRCPREKEIKKLSLLSLLQVCILHYCTVINADEYLLVSLQK